MLWVVPYLTAASVGIWLCVPGVRIASIEHLSLLAGAIGVLNAGYSVWAQKIDLKLGMLERTEVLDLRVQRRLVDRVAARRGRLAAKRAVIFCCGILATCSAAVLAVSQDLSMQVAGVLVSMAGAAAGSVGSVLLFFEASSLDDRVAEIERYATRLKRSAEEAANLKRASAPAPKRQPARS